MSNLNPPNNLKDLVISTFQEILHEEPNFFFTDRLSILTWKSKKIPGALITKVGNLRYLGFSRKDVKGQEYWKYKPLVNSENSEEKSSAIQNSSSLNQSENSLNNSANTSDSIAKFRQRQLKTEQINHGKSSNSAAAVSEQSQ